MVKIGNAQAFWGDQIDAPHTLATLVPSLDYLTLDYLAEVSLSILAIQKEKDPSLGYARDFVSVVESLLPLWNAGSHLTLISNAGGLNPIACAEACINKIKEHKTRPIKIAVVEGDNVLHFLQEDIENSLFNNLDDGRLLSSISDQLVTANAYLGADPLVEALKSKPDIVITGRVADPSLVVAPCMAHYGWSATNYNALAGATIAGHLIECGTQVTGGISTNWLEIKDPAWIGFPIVDVKEDGSCIVSKPEGTTGQVTEWTVKEQLLYEIGDPSCYYSPDVTVSFLDLSVKEIAPNQVAVEGASGKEPLETFKVCGTYRDGFRSEGTLTFFGENVEEKARRAGKVLLQRLESVGCKPNRSIVECIGTGDVVPGTTPKPTGLKECVLRIAISDPRKEVCERFSKELAPLVTSGPQGTTGYIGGRPSIRPVFGFWPCQIQKNQIQTKIELLEASQ